MKIMNRMMLAAMVSTSLGLVAMPALADPGLEKPLGPS